MEAGITRVVSWGHWLGRARNYGSLSKHPLSTWRLVNGGSSMHFSIYGH
ncbi:MAG: hypothetical protein ACTHQQ_14955 [Solirubrobacteraceae bacterium]